MRNLLKFLGIIALLLVIGFSMAGCDFGGTGGGGEGGGNTPGSTRNNSILVAVGYSSSHTISSSGEHWFRFVGTGNPVILETRGNVVDTYMQVYQGDSASYYSWTSPDNNSGEGTNALISNSTTMGTTYYIRITAQSNTNGTYTFVVTAPTTHLRANPITVSVGNSSSHIISSGGEHWFRFTGNGNRVFFETAGNVVTANMNIYIGESVSSSFSRSTNNPGINFYTIPSTIYYIRITGNSGTYTFNVKHGTGDGSTRYYAKDVTIGYTASHTITSSGEHWFIYQGTGNPVTFKTTGNVVDTYMQTYQGDSTSYYSWMSPDNNSGDGNNALISGSTTVGTTYYIRITTQSNTYGTYTFVVE